MEYMTIYIALAAVFGLYMAWAIGANDVANAMATSTGAKAISFKQAVIIAAVFEFAGAVLAGSSVTSTIRSGIVDASLMADTPELMIYGMLGSLLAAAVWLNIATRMGWPVSTTHSIIGAIVGFAAVGIGMEAVKWGQVGTIVMSWVVSPLVAGTMAFLIFRTVQALILDRPDPIDRARRYVPIYMLLAAFMITMMTLMKGLNHVGLNLSTQQNLLLATAIAVAVAVIGKLVINRIQVDPNADRKFRFATVEKIFGVLMVITACSMAFAHGSNDVANAVGPVAAVISVASTGVVEGRTAVSPWVLLLGGGGIVLGLATYGRKVMRTVGEQITALTPSRGFAAEMAAASTIVLASSTGLPISTTHTLVGAVLGVGMARGISAINLTVIRNIFLSWLVTVPAGAVLSVIFFFILRAVL
ncbi:inorganic phosphate transporter [Alkalisalibacterium limincola]|uniref:Phosphate transporter n=1 Tax=Alkalisalibacterium limincola TaxID=2699169 RepID=A0A5C8KMY4_9GAMM|nr:inorganic phosphate transporter [Alkalisalibacterium limincola]TXK60507.1 inorganic phosphate transporter [Alkalisalibacterium limincola]